MLLSTCFVDFYWNFSVCVTFLSSLCICRSPGLTVYQRCSLSQRAASFLPMEISIISSLRTVLVLTTMTP